MIVYARLLAWGCKTNDTFKAKPSTPPGISIVLLGSAPPPPKKKDDPSNMKKQPQQGSNGNQD